MTKPNARSRLQLPRFGFGAAPLGNLYVPVSDQEALSAVESALSMGIDYFDTAPHYGFGLSESRLGRAFQSNNDSKLSTLKISTKVGRVLVPTESHEKVRHGFVDTPPLTPEFNYTYDGVMRSFESSQKRLGRDHIDLLLAHDLGVQTHGNAHQQHLKNFLDGGYKAMCELQTTKQVAALGLGVNEWQIAQDLLQEIDLDFVLLASRYTLLEQNAAQEFFPLCQQKNVGVILGGVFNSGILATGIQAEKIAHYNYAPAPVEIIARVKQIETLCREYSVSLPAAAAQFARAHPQVSSVIFGLASPTQVNELMIWLEEKIPLEFWKAMQVKKLLLSGLPLPGEIE